MTQPAWLKVALSDVGYREQPVNRTKFGKHYGLDGQPWCAMAVSRWCSKSGHPLPSMQAGMKDGFAAAIAGMEYAKKHGAWRPSWEAEPGDLIIYGWDGPGSSWERMHVGMVINSGPQASIGHTVEGNRGDCVAKHTFTVGASVVLGTINVKKILGVTASPAPLPQPRPADHPTHTGPSEGETYPLHADLEELPDRLAAALSKELTRLHIVAVTDPADRIDRRKVRRATRLLRRALGRK